MKGKKYHLLSLTDIFIFYKKIKVNNYIELFYYFLLFKNTNFFTDNQGSPLIIWKLKKNTFLGIGEEMFGFFTNLTTEINLTTKNFIELYRAYNNNIHYLLNLNTNFFLSLIKDIENKIDPAFSYDYLILLLFLNLFQLLNWELNHTMSFRAYISPLEKKLVDYIKVKRKISFKLLSKLYKTHGFYFDPIKIISLITYLNHNFLGNEYKIVAERVNHGNNKKFNWDWSLCFVNFMWDAFFIKNLLTLLTDYNALKKSQKVKSKTGVILALEKEIENLKAQKYGKQADLLQFLSSNKDRSRATESVTNLFRNEDLWKEWTANDRVESLTELGISLKLQKHLKFDFKNKKNNCPYYFLYYPPLHLQKYFIYSPETDSFLINKNYYDNFFDFKIKQRQSLLKEVKKS